VKQAREAWYEQFLDTPADRLVFLDEFGASTNMQRTHGRAAAGQRVVSKVPHGHWKIISTIAAMTTRGMVAADSFDGATDRELFVTFVRESLVPVLEPGQVVIMDNLSAHKSPVVRELIESAGAMLLYLPPYSPDYNPIELAISKVKSVLRTLARREVADLLEAIETALCSITPNDAAGFLRHRRYTL
jgi:transposase